MKNQKFIFIGLTIILAIIMAGIYSYQLRNRSEPLLSVVNQDAFIPDEPVLNPSEIKHEIDEGIAILFDVRIERRT